jgi:subfamily B ATP-binding cassette protein MsbA
LPTSPAPQGTVPLLKRLSRAYLKPYRWRFAFALCMALVEGLSTAAIAWYLQDLLDSILTPDNEGRLLPFAAAVFITFMARGLGMYLHAVTVNMIGQGVVATIQAQVYGHLVRSDLAFLHGRASGEFVSRLVNDVAQMRAAVAECVAGMIRHSLTLVALVAVMFARDWVLACIAFLIFPVAGVVLGQIGRRLRRVAGRTQRELGAFTALLGQTFLGARHVKAYGMEAHEEARAAGSIQSLRRLAVKSFRISSSLLPINETFSGLVVVAIILYGGLRIADGTATAGELVSFIGAFMLAYQPMNALTKLNAQLQIGLASAERVLEILDTRPTITDRPGAAVLPVTVQPVRFDGVSFRYGEGVPALDRVDLEIPAGRMVALVGSSGAGKSTVLNLIPRFHDVTDGRVTIGGRDVREVTLASLRANIALVSQDTALFDDTIRANIAYGRADADEAAIIQAARDAAAHDFIMALPDGYDTPVGENGARLSGGQRQRIAIARAMLKNAPILLLDEATSALDSESERLIQEALKRLQRGRTTLVIAHRLSTIMEADRIHVLDQGRVVEQGTHGELIAAGGAYARFHAIQLGAHGAAAAGEATGDTAGGGHP